MIWRLGLAWIFSVAFSFKFPPFPFYSSTYEQKFAAISEDYLLIAKEQTREMFYFGYYNYLNHAFPLDELDPIHCRGRGHDHKNLENFNVNDALGDYSLTLIDSLNTLVVLGDKKEFHRAVNLVLENVSFEKNVTVQVFEVTIRIIGSLLSAHLILTNENPYHGNFSLPSYDGELLTLAHDMALRLLPAFEGTKTGIPYTRVNLLSGVVSGTINETCTAGAGSLLLEFGILSRLLNDETFENKARKVNDILWSYRHKKTGLLGNVIDIQSGDWHGILSGLGAGLDSFFEYLLKAYILFGEEQDLKMFVEAHNKIKHSLRRGRPKCRFGDGDAPFYVNVDMRDGTMLNTWIDSLQSSFSAVQVLGGDLDEAICLHSFYYALWQKYEMLPERFNWHFKTPEVFFYPLRPEFVESTYLLYLATKSPFYHHVGMQIIDSINLYTRVRCGFATVHNVIDKSLEDRMESFFLSETCKYLYLLFDIKNPTNVHYDRLLFSTEGHTFPITSKFRQFKPLEQVAGIENINIVQNYLSNNMTSYLKESCEVPSKLFKYLPPLEEFRLQQYYKMAGIEGCVVSHK